MNPDEWEPCHSSGYFTETGPNAADVIAKLAQLPPETRVETMGDCEPVHAMWYWPETNRVSLL